MNRMKLRLWDPVLNKGAIWTYWEGRLSRHRQGRGRDHGHPDTGQGRLVLEHPAARQHRLAGVVAPFDYLFKGRKAITSRTYQEESNTRRRSRSASRTRRASPGTSRRGTTRIDRTSCAGNGWVLVGDAFGFLDPPVFVGRAACAQVRRARRDAIIDGVNKGDTARRSSALGRQLLPGVDRMRRLVCEYYDGFSYGNFVKNYPDLRNTVTDLLIGVLFTDKG
jgi:flavin-dependent dehydrogenase